MTVDVMLLHCLLSCMLLVMSKIFISLGHAASLFSICSLIFFFALLSLQISGCYSIFQFSCFRKSLENVNCLFLTIISLHEFVSFKMSSLLSSFVQSVLSIILLNHITVASQAISRLYVDHPFFTLHVTASLPFTLPSKFS